LIDIGFCGFIDIGNFFQDGYKGHWMVCEVANPRQSTWIKSSCG